MSLPHTTPLLSRLRIAVGAWTGVALCAHAALLFPETSFTATATTGLQRVEHAFPFSNTGSQTVRVERCILSCGSCARAQAVPDVIPPGATGSVAFAVTVTGWSTTNLVVAHVLTDEGVSAITSLRITVIRSTGTVPDKRIAIRLTKRAPTGLASLDVSGRWNLTATDIWFDAPAGESPALDPREREIILTEDFPVGKTHLDLRRGGTFRLETGRHRAVGHWTVDGDRLPLAIEPPGCTNHTCWKVWALEAVSASPDRLLVDLPDEDEGSPRLIRLDFARERTHDKENAP